MNKNIAVISVSSILLVAAVIGTVTYGIYNHDREHADSTTGPDSVSTSSKASHAICQSTDYKDTCEKSLANVTDDSDPTHMIQVVFQAAINGVKDVMKKSTLLQKAAKDPKTAQAFDICEEVLQSSINDIQRSVDKINTFDKSKLNEYYNDVQTWLSGAITYQQTCLDAFENKTGDTGEKMKKLMETTSELSSNGLAMVNQLYKIYTSLASLGFGSRRLLDEDNLDDSTTRRLLDADYYPDPDTGLSATKRKPHDPDLDTGLSVTKRKPLDADYYPDPDTGLSATKRKPHDPNLDTGLSATKRKPLDADYYPDPDTGLSATKRKPHDPNLDTGLSATKRKPLDADYYPDPDTGLSATKHKPHDPNLDTGLSATKRKPLDADYYPDPDTGLSVTKRKPHDPDLDTGLGATKRKPLDADYYPDPDTGLSATKRKPHDPDLDTGLSVTKRKPLDADYYPDPDTGLSATKRKPHDPDLDTGLSATKRKPLDADYYPDPDTGLSATKRKPHDPDLDTGLSATKRKPLDADYYPDLDTGLSATKRKPHDPDLDTGLSATKRKPLDADYYPDPDTGLSATKRKPLDADYYPDPDTGLKVRSLLEAEPNTLTPNVTVAKDGSGQFKTIQEAINTAPKYVNQTFIILVKIGIYHEYVEVPYGTYNIFLIGEGPKKTRITGNKNIVDGTETFRTATVVINGDNFIAKDIGFENSAGAIKYQAVALRVTADKSIFYNCQIDGYQDTLYAHTHRQFYRNCTISGTIDFIFGDAAAVFQNCKLVVRKPLDYQECIVTAQGRGDINSKGAFVLQNCTFSVDKEFSHTKPMPKVFIGRPWRAYSRTIVMQSYMSKIIAPEGWALWSGDFGLDTLSYSEYKNRGPGSNTDKRVKWAGIKKLTPEEAEGFTPDKFIEAAEWVKASGLPYEPGMMPM